MCVQIENSASKRVHEYMHRSNSCIVKTVYGSSSGCVLCLDDSWCLC